MAVQMFQVEGGFFDGKIYILSGYGAPGNDGGSQDDAPVGSIYEDIANFAKYRKTQSGTGEDKWVVAVHPSDSNSTKVTQTAHGFSKGNWIYRNSDGSYKKAIAIDDVNNSYEVLGIVDQVYDADHFLVVTSGMSSVTDANPDASALFLSSSVAGVHTVTKPSVGVQKNLGFIINGYVFVQLDLSINVANDQPYEVPYIPNDTISTLHDADALLVDETSGCAWILEVTDSDNSRRFVAQVLTAHNGTDSTDATIADFVISQSMYVPHNSKIPGLAIGVGLYGAGAAQEVKLEIAADVPVTTNARRISV